MATGVVSGAVALVLEANRRADAGAGEDGAAVVGDVHAGSRDWSAPAREA